MDVSWVLAELPTRPTLPQQVPALVEPNLELGQARRISRYALIPTAKLVLLLCQRVDTSQDVLVVYHGADRRLLARGASCGYAHLGRHTAPLVADRQGGQGQRRRPLHVQA